MKSGKNTIISYLCQFCGIIITVVICFAIYYWGGDNDKACFALTLGAIIFLILCFYNIIFKGGRKGMVVSVTSGLSVIVFANELYDYQKLKMLVPILNNVDPMIFAIIILGGALLVLFLLKLLIHIYNNAEDDISSVFPGGTVDSGNVATLTNKKNVNSNNMPLARGGNTNASSTTNVSHSNVWMLLYFILLIVFIGVGCGLFGFLYKNDILKQSDDFFEIVVSLLEYAGSVIMILLAVVIVIIFLIEMIRLIVSRMKTFFLSLKEEAKADTVPLYALSAILDIIVCYLTYKFTNITIDSFYNFVNSSRYLALPLLILFVGIAFAIFLRLTHATLLLLVEMKPENVKEFLTKVNTKTKIKEQVIEIIKGLIDIVLKSIITVLKFVAFIPDFFEMIYSFVFTDECESEVELEDENKAEDGELTSFVLNQSEEEV